LKFDTEEVSINGKGVAAGGEPVPSPVQPCHVEDKLVAADVLIKGNDVSPEQPFHAESKI
jgi:hypothetical protein